MNNMQSRELITLFMPVLNEVDGLKAILPRINPSWYDELIIVDGGSTDGTLEYLSQKNIKVLHEEKPGVVGAYNQAFRESKGDIFITFTPDGNCIPDLIPQLIEESRRGYDIVFASRYLPPAKSLDDGLITGFGNWFFNKAVQFIFSAQQTDLLGGYRAYKRSALLKMNMPFQPNEGWMTARWDLLNTWEVGAVIRAAKLGLAVKEIPGDEPKRIGGVSKVSVLGNGAAIVAQIGYEIFWGLKVKSQH